MEIGAGKGIITKQLVTRAKQVLAIEVDEQLAKQLQNNFADVKNLTIINDDFLAWQLPTTPYKVFSNIPFNLTAEIIKKLTTDRVNFLSAYLIVQEKAAWRFTFDKGQTQIAILLSALFDCQIIAKLKRTDFKPVPKVNIVMLKLAKR